MLNLNVFFSAIERNPTIVAILDDAKYKLSFRSDSEVVFLLEANLSNLESRVKTLQEKGKLVFIHVDMIKGLSASPESLEYIRNLFDNTVGIISTKFNVIRKAKEENFITIYRGFLVDSKSKKIFIDNISNKLQVDAIEIMPGIIPKIVSEIRNVYKGIIICGGLITEKEEVYTLLQNGADAISTSSNSLIID